MSIHSFGSSPEMLTWPPVYGIQAALAQSSLCTGPVFRDLGEVYRSFLTLPGNQWDRLRSHDSALVQAIERDRSIASGGLPST
jgi:hypothetical protein